MKAHMTNKRLAEWCGEAIENLPLLGEGDKAVLRLMAERLGTLSESGLRDVQPATGAAPAILEHHVVSPGTATQEYAGLDGKFAPSAARLGQRGEVAHRLGKLARAWMRLKEDKGDTEYHIVKLVLENHALIIEALESSPSSAAVAPVAWRYYLSENTGPTFTANADDPFVKAMRATPLYEQPSALPADRVALGEPAAYIFGDGQPMWPDGLTAEQKKRATPLYYAESAKEEKA